MKSKMISIAGILLGALLIAIGLYFFWAPSSLAAGGVSGLAIVIKAILPVIPIGVIIFALDTIMFTIGFLTLGKSFGVKSLFCSLSVSVLTTVLELIWPAWQPIGDDLLLQLIFGALLIALGQAVVFNLDASSGGTDIIAKIISKYTRLPIGFSLMIADMVVVLFATFILGLEKGLYAALGVIGTTQLIDYFISGLEIKRYIMIVPTSHEMGKLIGSYILDDLGRGATIYKGTGAYSSEEKEIITTVIDRREFVELRRQLLKIDPNAFMTAQNLHEVIGEGFSRSY